MPGGDSSWADILDFKAAQQNNRWAFRRFLHDVVSERQTEAEIRDDIEWTINEYTKELDRFQLKRSVTFMETYIIPTGPRKLQRSYGYSRDRLDQETQDRVA